MQIAIVLNNLASTLEKLAEPREAELLYERALTLAAAALEKDDARVAHIRLKLDRLRGSLFAFPGLQRKASPQVAF